MQLVYNLFITVSQLVCNMFEFHDLQLFTIVWTLVIYVWGCSSNCCPTFDADFFVVGGSVLKVLKDLKKIDSDDIIPFGHQKKLFDLSKSLNIEIQLKGNKKGNGKIIIPFTDDDKLSEIFNKIKI